MPYICRGGVTDCPNDIVTFNPPLPPPVNLFVSLAAIYLYIRINASVVTLVTMMAMVVLHETRETFFFRLFFFFLFGKNRFGLADVFEWTSSIYLVPANSYYFCNSIVGHLNEKTVTITIERRRRRTKKRNYVYIIHVHRCNVRIYALDTRETGKSNARVPLYNIRRGTYPSFPFRSTTAELRLFTLQPMDLYTRSERCFSKALVPYDEYIIIKI